MTIQLLKYIVEVAEIGSITEAAHSIFLCIKQMKLSKGTGFHTNRHIRQPEWKKSKHEIKKAV